MEQLVIRKRSGLEIPLFKRYPLSTVTKAEQRIELLSEDKLNVSIESTDVVDISKGDTIDVFGRTYRINQEPTETKADSKMSYDAVFESILYDLRRPQWMLPASVGFASTGDEPLTADLKGFADVLIYNANRVLGTGTWVLGEYPSGTEIKTLSFPKEKLLSVLQKLCQEYGIEFEIKTLSNVSTINFKKIGNILSDSFEYGKGKQLYSIQRANSASSDVVTRLYAFGSTKNLKSGYRNYSSRLRLSVNPESYIQDAGIVNPEAEINESTEYFEDIFPERTGVISDLVITDNNSFIDSSMDFDLNESDVNGTKWLITNTAAVVSFITGNLAGYEFELKEGGYNHAAKTFTLIPYKDERGQLFPDPNSAAFKMQIGDKFKILNINMPDSYVENAELRLFNKATERINEISKRKIQYSLVLNEMFFMNHAPELGTVNYFNVGDYITVIDPELNVNESIRITAISRDVLRPYRYDITVSESFDISIFQQLISDNKEMKDIVVRNKLSDPARSRRNWKTTNELSSMLDTLRAEMLLIYVEGGAYSTDIVSETNADGSVNKFRTSAGTIQHDEYLENGGLWNVSAFEGIMSANVPYYVYVKASRGNNAASIVISATKISVEQDPMFYHFPYGILSSVFDGVRVLSSTKGYTRITGNNIHTGRLVSNDGTMWIDLDTGEIRGTFRFTSGELVEDVVAENTQTSQAAALAAATANNYIDNVLPDRLNAIDAALDGLLEQHFQTYDPELTNEPALSWDTTALKEEHLGDLFYNTSNGKSWRWIKEGSVYSWSEIINSDLQAALAAASKAQDTADSKRRVFTVTPFTPYDVGDLWVQGASGDIMKCNTAKTQAQVYASSDWDKAVKYTDDTAANAANALLADIASDSKLTPSEKQQTKLEWDGIIAEKATIEAQATLYAITTEKTAYTTAYNSLNVYITPLLSSLTTTSEIDGILFRASFSNYFSKRQLLLKAISDKAKSIADAAQTTADEVKDKTGVAYLPPGTIIINPSTGTITANLINTDELIAKKIRTGTTGTRVEINIDGDAAIRAFNQTGSVTTETFSVVNGSMKVKGIASVGNRRMEIDTSTNDIVFFSQDNKVVLRIEDDADSFIDNDSAHTTKSLAGMVFYKTLTSNPSNPDIVRITANGIYSNASTANALLASFGGDTAYGAIVGYNRRRESLLTNDVNAGIIGLAGPSGVYGGFFKHIGGGVSLRVDGTTEFNGAIRSNGQIGRTFDQDIGGGYKLRFVNGIYINTV